MSVFSSRIGSVTFIRRRMMQEMLLLWAPWDRSSLKPKLELLQRGPKEWDYPETVSV